MKLKWMPPHIGIGLLTDMLLRKKFSSRKEVFLGIPVYFIETTEDLSFASSLLDGAANLLITRAPFWEKQVKNVFSHIMIVGQGPMFSSDRTGRCFKINPLKFTTRDERANVILAMNLIAAFCMGLLSQGRFGYFGVKNNRPIIFMVAARFLQKCNSNGDFSNRISWCYQQIDRAQPGRCLYERFRLEESIKGRPEPDPQNWTFQ
jgi:hypothetical protein